MEDEIKRVKQEFAKAFGWYKLDHYSRDEEPTTPSWEKIFREVGKLQARIYNNKISERVNDIEVQIYDIQNNSTSPSNDNK